MYKDEKTMANIRSEIGRNNNVKNGLNGDSKYKDNLKNLEEGASLSSSSGAQECDFCQPVIGDEGSVSLSTSDSCFGKLRIFFACPPHGLNGKVFTWFATTVIVWGCFVSILGYDALPKGNIFSILSLLLLAQIGGYVSSLVRLPPLLGMLLVGIMLRSVHGLDVIGGNIDQKWSAVLRKTALVIILIRAGLGLDQKALKQMSFMVLRLGVLPNLVEMAIVSLVAHFMMDFPWLWSVMLGFILAGVSPSVVVPCMLNLSDAGYGTDKGISTLVIAGLSIDNVISISGFGVMLGLIFSDGSVTWQALKGPIEVAVGLLYGCAIGSLCWYLPNPKTKGATKFQFVLLLGSGLLSLFGSMKVGYGGAGPIGCLATTFVAGIGWRKQGRLGNDNPVKKNFNFLWQIFLPLLFGLIGTEIKVSALNGNTVVLGLITLLISLSFRIVTSYFCVLGGNLSAKERIFVALAWLPKATIQAAVGSTALDMARLRNSDEQIESHEEILGKQVLTIAVLVILVAAPIGAAAIMLSAPKLLNRRKPNTVDDEEEMDERGGNFTSDQNGDSSNNDSKFIRNATMYSIVSTTEKEDTEHFDTMR